MARIRQQDEVEFAEIDQMLMPEMPVVNEVAAAGETNLVDRARRQLLSDEQVADNQEDLDNFVGIRRARDSQRRQENIRNRLSGRARQALDMDDDTSEIARLLGIESQSAAGQALDAGVSRIRGQIANINQARLNLREMDTLLDEIEQFQAETDILTNNMDNIDQLLRIGEESNEEQRRGLSKATIQKLKVVTYKAENKEKEEEKSAGSSSQTTCSICLVSAMNGDRVYELVCKHIFHVKCIQPWFEKSHVCPNCRRDLEPEH